MANFYKNPSQKGEGTNNGIWMNKNNKNASLKIYTIDNWMKEIENSKWYFLQKFYKNRFDKI